MIDSPVADIVLSIVIPVLNEAAHIEAMLQPLQALRSNGCELILVDGGSTDGSQALASPLVDQLINSEKGRARQMNAGAAAANGQYLLFLHADTTLPEGMGNFLDHVQQYSLVWGFFSVRLSGQAWVFRCIEKMMNLRSLLSSVATGDQCQWFERETFMQLGGYPDISLMEDVAISKRFRKLMAPLIWPEPVMTSSRRWEQKGVVKTVLLMWRLRLAYFLGVSPDHLVKVYYGER